jgi:hypothetical protein
MAPKGDPRPVRQHWRILWAAVFVVIMAFVLQVRGDQVGIAGIPGKVLPQVCWMRRWFGINCPTCGLTRSFVAMAHGQWQMAYHFNHLGWLAAGLVLLQIPYRLAIIRRGIIFTATERGWITAIVIGLFLANWILMLGGWWPA